ncbi:carboxypeptidase-like regulatory domain-containing protein [Psychroflexus sp. MES1-P1E]|uniref:carboxypeptidase-like regulatory domain-containing protein n=1 Tax=Psychroflexus sp. MES1-P1E TaxID=2058320 RepID=UPI000C7973A5|nr:carboxypeptidase-like regulatory domain-containing protein [Psychroflexus sp. MES1-P1E]PKG43144.1 TonB-dependent receptor [Psychroflexus sp. MES1-P1E]
MKKITFILLSFAFLSCGSDSQLVDGKVTTETDEPLENVLVQVMGTDLNSKTNSNGSFRINTKNRGDELIFTHPTYEMLRLTIDENQDDIQAKLIKKNTPELEK